MNKILSALTVFFVLMIFYTSALADDITLKRAKAMFRPIPLDPPTFTNNPANPDKLELGKMLFFEPRLSKSALISCNTCHNLGLGGSDFQERSIGHGWQRGGRNSPTVLNAVYNIAQFWDGRASDLKEQAKGPVQAGVEMNNTPAQVIKTLASMPEYVSLFSKAFPEDKDSLSFDNMAKAIEVFEATLITPNSAFDKYLLGNASALSAEEQQGLKIYMDKGCAACHGGINLGGTGYFTFGVVEKPAEEISAGDKGRFKFTGSVSDEYVFKSPSLRNIELTAPYFHSGKVWGLKEAVAIMGSAQLGISLTEAEVAKIVSLLKTTTGDQPKVTHPILPPPTAATPLPKD